ncbi:hypothetical protein [Methanoregula sp.]|uniref:hypothetical protein n=1 Tax=Methanoregula sp. TaxID=2052170 RepID=UPI003C75DA5F
MKYTIIPVFVLVIVICIFASGCTSAPGPAPAATRAAAPATTATPAVTVTATLAGTDAMQDNGPVRFLPSAQQVNLDLTKDRPTSELHLLYQGGPGDVFTQKIVMRVYSSGNVYQEYVMSDGQKPVPGDEIVATGTRGGDRCVVYVYSAGTGYKVIDEVVYSAM